MSRVPSPLVAATDGQPGCPETITDGPYLLRCSLGVIECARHGRFETVPRPQPAAPTSAGDRVETAARVLHSRRHRFGYSHVCDACRGDARAVAAALTEQQHRTEVVTDKRTGEAVGGRCSCGTTWNAPEVRRCPEVTP